MRRRGRDPINHAYLNQRGRAKARGIPFLLTREQWLYIWTKSGKWSQRGAKSNEYCMSRFNDQGAYEIGNVEIRTNRENAIDRNRRYSGKSLEERMLRSTYMKNYWARLSHKERTRLCAAIGKGSKGKPKPRKNILVPLVGRRMIVRKGKRTWARPGDFDYPKQESN